MKDAHVRQEIKQTKVLHPSNNNNNNTHRLSGSPHPSQINKGISTITLHTHNTNITTKIPCITPTNRQPIPQPRKRRIYTMIHIPRKSHHTFLYAWIGRSKQITPNLLHMTPWYTTPLIRHLDHHIFIFIPIGNNDTHGRIMIIHPMMLHRSPHGILQQFQQYIMQMRRYVRKSQIQSPTNNHFRCIPKLTTAHHTRIIHRMSHNLQWRRLMTNHADVILQRWLSQCQVLPCQHTYAHTGHVEPI
mmetsp:Transcript_29005/g.43778  ORF Transcript_29005/g.43778 Transcript_29005/m.43778 type:complete len:245 (-) Transcript_29005:691-1425(-)